MRLQPSVPAPHATVPRSLKSCVECAVALEADHRIANHLAMLAGYIGIKATSLRAGPALISRADVALMLQAIRSQVQVIARVHRGLMFDDGAAPDLCRHIHEVCQLFRSTLSTDVRLVEDLNGECLVTAKQLLPLSQIVAEALANAIKYAHPAGRAGTIVVRCRRDVNGLKIEVADDGVGLPPSYDVKTNGGYGASLIARLARQLGATLSVDAPEKGGHQVAVALP